MTDDSNYLVRPVVGEEDGPRMIQTQSSAFFLPVRVVAEDLPSDGSGKIAVLTLLGEARTELTLEAFHWLL